MNRQKAFDIVATHLMKQKVPCRNENGDCVFRNKDNLKCAIGALIPDNLYTPSIESIGFMEMSSNVDISNYWKQEYGLDLSNYEDRDFLSELMTIHDFETPDDWERELILCVKKYRLIFPTI